MSTQPWALNVLRPVVTMLVVGLALVVASSWLATWHWVFELVTHFHIYFLLAGAALALVAVGLRLWWTAGLSALIVAASFSVVWPHMHLPPADLQPQPGPVVRLLWANLHNAKGDPVELQRLVEAEKPDIAVFTELDPIYDAALRDVRGLLPFQSPLPRGNAFGVMLLAKKPPESLNFDLTLGRDAPLMVSRLCPTQAGCLTLLALHAWRPGLDRTAARDRQLAQAAAVARQHLDKRERVVLIGDLNLTPFSPVFQRLLAQSGLWDTAILPAENPRTSPFISTWQLANTGLGLPIDHALVSAGIGIVSRRIGPDIGSDHRPLILDLKIAP